MTTRQSLLNMDLIVAYLVKTSLSRVGKPEQRFRFRGGRGSEKGDLSWLEGGTG